jgi:enamine deaminase RidA (YjgF/YER057c/UK114 family)
MSAEARLQTLQLELPPPPKPAGVYRPALIIGDLCYLSGHLPVQPDGTLIKGRVGADLTQQDGAKAAQRAALAILATLKVTLGSLDRVQQLVKLMGMVQCTPEFEQQPAVINGCSELLIEVFGDSVGVGTRSAFGVHALPLGVAVEIEAIFQVQ